MPVWKIQKNLKKQTENIGSAAKKQGLADGIRKELEEQEKQDFMIQFSIGKGATGNEKEICS